MAILLTGSTGYIGAHVASNLLADHSDSLNLLVRARDLGEARGRLWRAFQLHMDFPVFDEFLHSRIRIFLGDLTDSRFGLPEDEYRKLVCSTDSVIHCAASLNRRSEKSCLNVNLRGTLEVIQLAMRARDDHGLRRFSHVSTVAVAGHRANEVVEEDTAIDWNRSDYDPYARTKKFCEHMVRQLLPDVPHTIFRPSIVLGDSRRPETNQFEMVRAFVFLAGLPALPFRATDKIDIVPVDYVAGAIATLHQKEKPDHEIYHLSSGTDSETFVTADRCAGESARQARAGVRAGTRRPIVENDQRSRRTRRKNRRTRHSAESFSAVSRVEHGVRQPARGRRDGAASRAIFSILLSPAALQPRKQFPLQVPRTAGERRSRCGARRDGDRGSGFPPMIDMDTVLEAWVSGLIELNKLEWMLGAGKPWKPGEKLKLLFAGYNGTRNTGSDIRVEEILRQVQRILGAQNIAPSVMTQDFELTRGYFDDARQVHLPDVFPPFLHSDVRESHGVIACEGSMFKSKFASALTAMMIGALGIASAQNKLSVAYGGEAGAMDPLLQKMCERYCPRIAGDHAQRGIAGSARQTRRLHRTRHGHRMDLRAARLPNSDARLCATPVGTARLLSSPSARSIRSGGRSSRRSANGSRTRSAAPTRRATIARFTSTGRDATSTPRTRSIFRRWPLESPST